jgi:hypothetical protein
LGNSVTIETTGDGERKEALNYILCNMLEAVPGGVEGKPSLSIIGWFAVEGNTSGKSVASARRFLLALQCP